MNVVRTRLHIAEDGSISGRAPDGIPPGDHDAEIAVEPAPSLGPLPDKTDFWAGILALEDEVSRLPVLDCRTPNEILGYNECGLFD